MGLSLGIITKNEEKNIKECILSVKEIVDEIVVVDDCSDDATLKIAQELGAKVYIRKLDDFSAQKNYLIAKCQSDWILILDADERIDGVLKDEIKKILSNSTADGYEVLRKNFIFGKHLKYGGNGNDWVLRLFQKSKAQFFNPVHEVLRVNGKVERIRKGCILHNSIPNLTNYVEKLNLYTELESRFIKKRKFLILRLVFAPILVFVKRYFFKLGILDGQQGLIFYILCSMYTFVKYVKALFES